VNAALPGVVRYVRKIPAGARGAWWALRAVRSVRRQLRSVPLHLVAVPSPQPASPGSRRGVDLVLGALSPSCLERALVLQRWLAADGDRRAVIIGVTPASGFHAHAWLDGERNVGFVEIVRMPPCAP
jgi:hypothetical protein